MLNVHNLSKSYGKKKVLDSIDVTFPNNGVTIIVGINGSGKTTMLNMLAGLLAIDDGAVVSCNGALWGSMEYKQNVFYVPSDFYLPDFLRGSEYADFVMSRYLHAHRKIFNDMASIFGLGTSIDSLIGTYSYGMKKKLQLAIAACVGAQHILIDEGFAGLDFETSLLVQEIFDDLAGSANLVVVTHEEHIIRNFPNDIYLLSQGTLSQYVGDVENISYVVRDDATFKEKINNAHRLLGTS